MPRWWTLEDLPELDICIQANPAMDYRGALGKWMSVLGRPAMLPRSAFGVWWSRYYRYSEETIVSKVLDGYRNNSSEHTYTIGRCLCSWVSSCNSPICFVLPVPLNALVMDME